MTAAAPHLQALRAGGKLALARALAALEAAPQAPSTLALLDEAWAEPLGQVIGLTGPPGVGKSTLTSALVQTWRARGRRVGIIAIDPSSRRSGGALLGDRTRIALDPEDRGVFLRSLAARDRLGGLAALAAPMTVLMRALFDIVLVETVGVGQSETEIEELADSVVLAVQPASGDALQFMKAGIVEIPDVAIVTKADLGDLAGRTARELRMALRQAGGRQAGWILPVLLVSSQTGQGMEELVATLDRHALHLREQDPAQQRRHAQGRAWLVAALREEVGRRGLARALPHLESLPLEAAPFGALARLLDRLSESG
ncbi:methylmalonyl Co-A mutase-associated GTPase MeaB [Geminicoccaceae bacterium 1502E]|nr:methylmalonyl Co-A mutase-associated GTPase MeaB [Geminicoccaceae bacterium 1502E]